MQEISFRSGEILFKEGDPSDVAYLILEGKIEIYKNYPKGTVLLATLEAGEITGEMGIITEEPRAASAQAATNIKVRVIHRAELTQMIESQPEGMGMVIRALMRRLKEANHMLSILVNKQSDFQFLDHDAAASVKRILLLPKSEELRKQLSKNGLVVTNLPFRIGGLPPGADAAAAGDLNDFFIYDADMEQVSRNHCAIQRNDKGLCIVDRGSKKGTLVNKNKIGGGIKLLKEELIPGENEIVIGDAASPYRFTILWE